MDTRKWTVRVLVGMAVLFVLIQIIRPARTNPAIDSTYEIGARASVDPAVIAILNRSCNDCHSNRTIWPWYSGVAPVSWLVASDVNGGRRHVNFSEWFAYPPDKRMKLLEEICKEVKQGDMPPIQYTPMHRGSRLTSADATALCDWTASARVDIDGGAPGGAR
jgi:hypothetical protein